MLQLINSLHPEPVPVETGVQFNRFTSDFFTENDKHAPIINFFPSCKALFPSALLQFFIKRCVPPGLTLKKGNWCVTLSCPLTGSMELLTKLVWRAVRCSQLWIWKHNSARVSLLCESWNVLFFSFLMEHTARKNTQILKEIYSLHRYYVRTVLHSVLCFWNCLKKGTKLCPKRLVVYWQDVVIQIL